MKDIKEIKTLIKVIKEREKIKTFSALTIYLTNYYFNYNFDIEHTDKELLEKMAMLFWLYISAYLVCPYKRKKKTLEEIFKDIDEEMYEYKQTVFNKWFFENLPLTEKQIEEKRMLLRLKKEEK